MKKKNNKSKDMKSTTIHFNEKQDFSSILKIIEQNFNVIHIEKGHLSSIIHVGFEYKGENIYCYFSRDNKIYYNDGRLLHFSTLSSDRLSSLKDEAFKIIASKFRCKFWADDHDYDNFIEFDEPKKEVENTRRSHIWVMRVDVTYFDDRKTTHFHYAETLNVLHERAKEVCKEYNLRFVISTNPDHEFIFLDGDSFHYGYPNENEVNPTRKQISFQCTKELLEEYKQLTKK
jgi:hypothetical protein